jgi:hypothetical protein
MICLSSPGSLTELTPVKKQQPPRPLPQKKPWNHLFGLISKLAVNPIYPARGKPLVGCRIAFKDIVFTKVCNSHPISSFTMFFIVIEAKASIIQLCFARRSWTTTPPHLVVVVPTPQKKNRLYARSTLGTTRHPHKKILNDPFAGSPTKTLLRLLLPTDRKVQLISPKNRVHQVHLAIQSVGATGGVYKRQGRNQCKIMTCAY